ncbi:GT-D fold domain-containing glycosyltransferase [Cesiribacter sp. SM1]|uniref:GT-D fold domain-containing glycosyltransferase n=1 Tax=Cesiribacter sp. SM1 TaxID=2861196 RepID=UPI001CD6023F|nr:GT-D fold domain-containing glycosyltransferase [Cesiribacter sp. SM1]
MQLSARSVYGTLEHLDQQLKEHKRVFYTRFGDGEIYIMQGKGTIDHAPAPELTAEIKKVFAIEHPQFLKAVSVNYPRERGMVDGVFAPFPDNDALEQALLQMGEKPGTVYDNFISFHYLSLFDQQRMQSFLDQHIRPKRKMFIGSSDKRVLEYVFGKIDVYVQLPGRDAFYTLDEWFPKVREQLEGVDVVLPAAGAATKVVQRLLWESGAPVHSIDMGSVADVVQQRGTRRWIRLLGHRSRKIMLPGWQQSGLFKQSPVRDVKQELKYLFHKLRAR